MRQSWSQEFLASKLGITRSKLALLESGHTTGPSIEDIIKFSTLFNISIDVMLKCDLSIMTEAKIQELEAGDTFNQGTRIRILATTVDSDNIDQVELVSEKARASYRNGCNDPEWIAELPRYSIPGLSKHQKHRIFSISGDSMLPYPDGCYIIGQYVDDWTNLKDGTLCILILKSDGTDLVFKQVYNWIGTRKSLFAKSLNLIYQPFEVPIDEVIEIWQYKAHLTDHITERTVETSVEQILPVIYDIKLNVEKISQKLRS